MRTNYRSVILTVVLFFVVLSVQAQKKPHSLNQVFSDRLKPQHEFGIDVFSAALGDLSLIYTFKYKKYAIDLGAGLILPYFKANDIFGTINPSENPFMGKVEKGTSFTVAPKIEFYTSKARMSLFIGLLYNTIQYSDKFKNTYSSQGFAYTTQFSKRYNNFNFLFGWGLGFSLNNSSIPKQFFEGTNDSPHSTKFYMPINLRVSYTL